MGITIHDKYSGLNYYPLTENSDQILAEVIAEAAFSDPEEIFRGTIYEAKKVGSIVYKGLYKNKKAILKLQGIKPELEESEDIKRFQAQNQSLMVRLPELYVSKNWDEEKGYGYMITEFVDESRIFKMPFANTEEMNNFARFYQEYKSLAVKKAWIDQKHGNAFEFTKERVEKWKENCVNKKRLKEEDYLPFYNRFIKIVEKNFGEFALEFCHGHLTANDICVTKENKYILFSNLLWSYRPQWYDLSFNIWACLQHIRDLDYNFEQLREYVEKWLSIYKEIPIVKEDFEFEKKIYFNLLERLMGAILMDLGVREEFDQPEKKPYLSHLLKLHQQLFDYLESKIQSLS